MKAVRKIGKTLLKAVLQPEFYERFKGEYWDLEILLKCWVSSDYWNSVAKLRAFKDKHKGERCFIIGNGPSLNRMDLSYLKNEVTFGLNRIYLLFDKLGFSTTYYAAVNPHVIEQCAAEIENLSCTSFIRWDFRQYLRSTANLVFIRPRNGPRFCCDVSKDGIWEGGTVTYVAMQLAYHMGFSEVVLVGVDHYYKTKGGDNEVVISTGEDVNHFDPSYFGRGFKWQLPDLKTSEKAYGLAKEAYSRSGRSILDATVDGKLEVFPKIRYTDIVKMKTTA